MKQLTLLAALAVTVVAVSAAAGAVRANEMAGKAAEAAQAANADAQVTVATLDEVTAAELQVLIDTEENLVIIDSRREEDYVQGHIPGAALLRPDDVSAEKLAALAASTDTPLVFYCTDRQCASSGKAAHKAAELGYTRLYKYTDGLVDWQAKGLPIVTQ